MRLAQRARIVLLAAQGLQSKDIAAQLGVGQVQVSRWRERYAEARFTGIERDLPRGALGGVDHPEQARSSPTGAHARWSQSSGSAPPVSRVTGARMA
ncbi:MAG: helix-turn-helix domain-containing protein [Polaromonas sp.]|nr:helix-turn-helix domain-containing protein [Polaromonas sp.]